MMVIIDSDLIISYLRKKPKFTLSINLDKLGH
jgi:hypothetical protein